MSYINDALRKAQHGKNSRYENYGDIIAPPTVVKDTNPMRKWVIGITTLLILLTFSGVALYYYQYYYRDKVPIQALISQRQEAHLSTPVLLPDKSSVVTSKDVRPPAPLPAKSPVREETLTQVPLPQQQSVMQDKRPPLPSSAKPLGREETLTLTSQPAQRLATQGGPAPVPVTVKSPSKEQPLHAYKGDNPPGLDTVADAARLYREALVMQNKSRFTEAETLYEKTLALDPKHVQALNNLGVVYMTQKKNGRAVDAFRKAILLKKDYADPYYNLACLHSKWQNIDPALRYLKTAISINNQVVDWARADKDLNYLQSSPEFRSLIEKRGH